MPPVIECYGDFTEYLAQESDGERIESLRMSGSTGRPVGDEVWIQSLVEVTGIHLRGEKREPKRD